MVLGAVVCTYAPPTKYFALWSVGGRLSARKAKSKGKVVPWVVPRDEFPFFDNLKVGGHQTSHHHIMYQRH